jgi:hypothetical protein
MGGRVIPLNKGSTFKLDIPWRNADQTLADLTGYTVELFDHVNTTTMTATLTGSPLNVVELRMSAADVLANLLAGPVNSFRIRLISPSGDVVTTNELVIEIK